MIRLAVEEVESRIGASEVVAAGSADGTGSELAAPGADPDAGARTGGRWFVWRNRKG